MRMNQDPSMDETQGNVGIEPAAVVPVLLETGGFGDYALLDSGDGEKLERFGGYTVVRPEPQAMWRRALPRDAWQNADAVFTAGKDEDGDGRWRFGRTLDEPWTMAFRDVRFLGRFTAFRHVGVFPEQAPHWTWMEKRVSWRSEPPRILNLFGYTGIASILLAQAGAQVTHLDASRKAIAWARENQEASGADQLPIRWICDDAMKFVQREQRRGNRYQGIILDPPKFGRGPKNEVWDLFTDLAEMLAICRSLLADDASFLVLTAYSIRASFVSMHELMAEQLSDLPGSIESGELLLREESAGRRLSTSLFSRWSPT